VSATLVRDDRSTRVTTIVTNASLSNSPAPTYSTTVEVPEDIRSTAREVVGQIANARNSALAAIIEA